VFGRDDIIWGAPPGPGPALRNMVDEETRRPNRSWPGLWFFGIILFLFLILLPVFVAWDLVSPRTFKEVVEGPHAISISGKERQARPLVPTRRPVPPASRAHPVRSFGAN
jgi:hypothetical protein